MRLPPAHSFAVPACIVAAVIGSIAAAPAAFARTPDAGRSAASPTAVAASRCGATHTAGAGRRQAHAILCLVNAERARHGLRRLRRRHTLATAAARYARQLSRRNWFAHVSPSGSTPAKRVRRAGYHPATLGETLAYGRGYWGTPAGIVAQWLASPPHRQIVLEPRVRDLGVGVARGIPRPGMRGGVTVAAEFARR